MVMCLKGYRVNSCGDKYLRIYMESIFASVSSLVIYAWFSSFLFFFQFDFFLNPRSVSRYQTDLRDF